MSSLANLVPGSVDDVDWSGSLLELREAEGTRVTSAIAQLCVDLLSEAGQQGIGKRTSEPRILLVHRNLDEDERVVIFAHDDHRYDRFTFNVFRQRA